MCYNLIKKKSYSKEQKMKITDYQPKYKEDALAVCVNTAPKKAKTNAKFRDFILKLYCEPYLDTQKAFVLVDDEDKAQGYIICAPDCEGFCKAMEKYLAELKKTSFIYYLVAKDEPASYRKFAKEYPAHLHIDINEEYTHGGWGTKLMDTLFDWLRENNIPGVMLHCAANNKRGVAFYEKYGFKAIKSNKFSITFAKKVQ